MARQILTLFDPDKKSAVLRQKIGECAAAFRLHRTAKKTKNKKQKNPKTNKQTNKTNKQTNKQTGKQTNKQTSKQANNGMKIVIENIMNAPDTLFGNTARQRPFQQCFILTL